MLYSKVTVKVFNELYPVLCNRIDTFVKNYQPLANVFYIGVDDIGYPLPWFIVNPELDYDHMQRYITQGLWQIIPLTKLLTLIQIGHLNDHN